MNDLYNLSDEKEVVKISYIKGVLKVEPDVITVRIGENLLFNFLIKQSAKCTLKIGETVIKTKLWGRI